MAATLRSTTVQATLVYVLDPPRLLGRMHSLDRVLVEYVSDSTEDDGEPYIDITIKGWRLTSRMVVDRRQTERETVYLPRDERLSFVREELGIDYEADLWELVGRDEPMPARPAPSL